jgi:hypothetical protein
MHAMSGILQELLVLQGLFERNILIKKSNYQYVNMSRDSSMRIAMGRVRFPAQAKNFSLLYSGQTDSGGHPVTCSLGNGSLSPGIKWLGCKDDHSPPF